MTCPAGRPASTAVIAMATSEGQNLAERLIPRKYQIELFQEARKRNVGQNQLKVGMIAHKWFSCSTDIDKKMLQVIAYLDTGGSPLFLQTSA